MDFIASGETTRTSMTLIRQNVQSQGNVYCNGHNLERAAV